MPVLAGDHYKGEKWGGYGGKGKGGYGGKGKGGYGDTDKSSYGNKDKAYKGYDKGNKASVVMREIQIVEIQIIGDSRSHNTNWPNIGGAQNKAKDCSMGM